MSRGSWMVVMIIGWSRVVMDGCRDHRVWSFRVPEGDGGWPQRVMGCCRGWL